MTNKSAHSSRAKNDLTLAVLPAILLLERSSDGSRPLCNENLYQICMLSSSYDDRDNINNRKGGGRVAPDGARKCHACDTSCDYRNRIGMRGINTHGELCR